MTQRLVSPLPTHGATGVGVVLLCVLMVTSAPTRPQICGSHAEGYRGLPSSRPGEASTSVHQKTPPRMFPTASLSVARNGETPPAHSINLAAHSRECSPAGRHTATKRHCVGTHHGRGWHGGQPSTGHGDPAGGWGHVPVWKIRRHWQQHLSAVLLTQQARRQALPTNHRPPRSPPCPPRAGRTAASAWRTHFSRCSGTDDPPGDVQPA